MENMTDSLFQGDAIEQFRMRRFQVFNWGTFSGLHDIAISSEGHLFIGGSGSGKSTLLDAMSVLLTPGVINFNAAAREGEKRSDRTLLSYMRGAWTTQQDEEGRSVLQYLRKQSTWTALALTYESGASVVTLMFVGVIRGSSNDDARVLRHYYVVPDTVELSELSDFSKYNYDWTFIKKRLPQAKSYPRFAPYCENFRKVFGIEEETVFKLLHKAQSARNLGDLNQFLRKFMLDVPKTFEVADLLVNQFTELYEAHSTVVKARDQVQLLTQARSHYQKLLQAQKAKSYLEELRNYLPVWHLRQQSRLLAVELPKAQERMGQANLQYEQLCLQRESVNARFDELTRLYYAHGGDRLIQMKAELEQAKKQLVVAQKIRDRYGEQLQTLNLSLPSTFDEFCLLGQTLKDLQEDAAEQILSLRHSHDITLVQKSKKSDEFKSLNQDIKTMEATTSNLPAHLLQLRSELVKHLELTEADVPFVGELLEVQEQEQAWQGAIERVLHNFATSLLVSDKHYRSFIAYVNEHHLGARLVFHRVRKPADGPLSLYENTLVDKLTIKDGPWQQWVERELAERFNYACVAKVEEMARYERSITLAGQIKHNRTRHEKDDRFNIHDRRRWVLGFSNAQKLELYKQSARTLAQEIARLDAELEKIATQEKQTSRQIQSARVALEYEWGEIDTGSLLSQCRSRQQSYDKALENSQNLMPIEQERETLKQQTLELEREKEKAYSFWQECKSKQEELAKESDSVRESLAKISIKDDCEQGIEPYMQRVKIKLTLKNLSNFHDQISAFLLNEQDAQMNVIAEETLQTTSRFAEFKQRWTESTLQLDTSLMSASEYFEKLDDLLKEGLPRFEKKFKDLLTNEVRQNLTDLYREIDDERRLIKSRLQDVNQSLTKVAFNRIGDQESHLRIDIADKNLPEVQEFKKLQKQIMEIDLTQKELKSEHAERYFNLVNTLVQKFNVNGKDLASQRWRERVLDVRQHMDFYGVEYELTEDGERTVEVYQSAAGKSGGQRQKLTVTCLAAALRYQLGGKETDYPRYAAVILDEAFDKADSEFTDIALNIFKDFHFQMIIATPEKSVMTLDPYVGGTTYVVCKNRNQSSVLNVVYDSKTGHFAPLS